MLSRRSVGDCGARVRKESSEAAVPNTCPGLMGQNALRERQVLLKMKLNICQFIAAMK